MNSRERRKREASRHNLNYAHSQAIAQDRIEDPEKYRLTFSKKQTASHRKRKAIMATMVGAGLGINF